MKTNTWRLLLAAVSTCLLLLLEAAKTEETTTRVYHLTDFLPTYDFSLDRAKKPSANWLIAH